MQLVVDVENTYQKRNGGTDGSPYNTLNKLVSVGFYSDTCNAYVCVNHKEREEETEDLNTFAAIQHSLESATLLIGHNIKHDLAWLYSCGFKYEGKVWDTMIAEYVMAKGVRTPLSLKEVAKKYGYEKLDLDMLDGKVDEVPWEDLKTYGENDCKITWEIFKQQKELLENSPLLKTVEMTNEFCMVLTKAEVSGIKIDLNALSVLEEQYTKRLSELDIELNRLASAVMGDTPFNLQSPDDLSKILYSREVVNKAEWKQLFNIGSNKVTGKPLRTKFYKPTEFAKLIKEHTRVIRRTTARRCLSCNGVGKVRKVKKDGSQHKKDNLCKDCKGKGYLYIPTDVVAGFRLPCHNRNVSAAGFSASRDVIEDTLVKLAKTEEAKRFLTLIVEYNKVSTYLNTFILGIKDAVYEDVLHTTFNQCVTATGRLSCSNPNFQNIPRGTTFPIKKAIVSRFGVDGVIVEGDFAQLEFRIAGCLFDDKQIMQDVINKEDVHQFTADVLTHAGQQTSRQEAKSRTFKPLYGGQSGTEAELAYYASFAKKYAGVTAGHKILCEEVIKTGGLTLPSGRQYKFPYAKRTYKGGVTESTKIKNYPVQGFATADVAPAVTIAICNAIKELGLEDEIIYILNVHDSIVFDCHKKRLATVVDLLYSHFMKTEEIIKQRYGYEMPIPMGGEVKAGINWFDVNKMECL